MFRNLAGNLNGDQAVQGSELQNPAEQKHHQAGPENRSWSLFHFMCYGNDRKKVGFIFWERVKEQKANFIEQRIGQLIDDHE